MRETLGHSTSAGLLTLAAGKSGSIAPMLTTLTLLLACNPSTPRSGGGGGGGAPGGNGGFMRQPDPAPVPADPEPSRKTHPIDGNVLFIVLDDVGVDKMQFYGISENAPPTPALTKLAEQGRWFRNAWVQPMCSTTRAALMTGRYPRRTGVGNIIDWWKDEAELADSEVTVAEMLDSSKKTWSTSFVGKWHLSAGKGVPRAPGRQGFDWYRFLPGNLREGHSVRKGRSDEKMSYEHWVEYDNGEEKEVDGYVLRHQADDAIARMKEMPEPWFLWTAFTGVHVPLAPPPSSLYGNLGVNESSPEADLYDATLRALDVEVGRVVGSLTSEQRARTTIIVIGDNGTPDHAIRPPLVAREGKGSVMELGVRVPLIVASPLVDEVGPSEALVSSVDVFATIADLAGVDVGTLGVPIDGVSFYPALKKPGASGPRDMVYSERFAPNGAVARADDHRAVRDARWKLAVDVENGVETERFFDLSKGLEGPNLLRDGKLGAAQQQGHDKLRAEYDRLTAELGAGAGRGGGAGLPVKIPN